MPSIFRISTKTGKNKTIPVDQATVDSWTPFNQKMVEHNKQELKEHHRDIIEQGQVIFNGYSYHTNKETRENVLGLVTAINAGIAPEAISFTPVDEDDPQQFTHEQFLLLAKQILTFIQANFDVYRNKKKQIKKAKNKNDIKNERDKFKDGWVVNLPDPMTTNVRLVETEEPDGVSSDGTVVTP
jgi:hypothetical protein